jgi:peroxiredoxin
MIVNQFLRTILLCLVTTMACSCNHADQSFLINCRIEGLEEGTAMALIPAATHRNEVPVSITYVQNGSFSFTGELEEPRFFQITVNEENSSGFFHVFVEPGDIQVQAKAVAGNRRGSNVYTFENLIVEGSQAHHAYIDKTAPRAMLDKMYNDFNEKGRDIMQQVQQARAENNEVRLKELYASEAWKELAKAEKDFFDLVNRTMTTMILDNGNSWWGPFLMLNQMGFFGEEQKSWWEQFSPAAKESYYGRIVFAELFPEGFTGKPAPEFTVTTKTGEEASLQGLTKGKKYTMIDFWASWCAPCIKEIPNFKLAYELYSSKGFEIIGVSIDRNRDDWEKALHREQLPWPNFLDSNSSIADLYDVKLIPSTFLIDENGLIVAENLKGESLLNKLEELLQ